jgi:gliding motility-associated-like protein
MKKIVAFSLLLTCFSPIARASHITGGEMSYVYLGPYGSQYQYGVTLKLYMRCNSGRVFPDPAIISIFDKNTTRVKDVEVPLGQSETISLTNNDPCISDPPSVCYVVGYYYFTVTLPGSVAGYVLASQVNFRINGINNLLSSGNIGATYITEIPGTAAGTTGPENNSAIFTGSDLVIVCTGNYFQYSFAARDDDGDELSYSFCSAYNSSVNASSGNTNSSNNGPAGTPPFLAVPYNSPGFSESAPMGNQVHINSSTGLITGFAPISGIYVVTVCVQEIRNGLVIATQRKDVQIFVADCGIAAAKLQSDYILCGTSQTIGLADLATSPLIVSYNWQVFNSAGTSLFTSSASTPAYSFPDSGLYLIKLVINSGQTCADSTNAMARVYPGFKPGFNVTGFCDLHPASFTDITTSVYGTVNSWTWDFGEISTPDDVSFIENPVYPYPSIGVKDPSLIVTDTKGCRDTITKSILIFDKPPLNLAFHDTLICKNDLLQLQSVASGTFSWSPNIAIISGAATATPVVSPAATITYIVDLDDDGCHNSDSVRVRVVDHVTLQAMNNTTICQGDAIQLATVSDALHYIWTPPAQLSDATIQDPLAVTNTTTGYQVTAVIGGCSATKQVIVTTVPYPSVFAGKDTIICYNTPAQLYGITDGSRFSWSPATSLSNSTILDPLAYPSGTTVYILSASDTKGCPKPQFDTMVVTVNPKMHVSAGRDTSVIVGQPLQLNATGDDYYSWIPATNLSSSTIANPVAVFTEPSDGILYKVVMHSSIGCADSAYITIKVFKTGATVFVPSAFTPNNDGKNDILRPIAVGMQRIEYFSIYDRWGQLVFNTTANGAGWDGKVNGTLQGTNTFVWMVKAIDFKGAPYFQKGYVTLMR